MWSRESQGPGAAKGRESPRACVSHSPVPAPESPYQVSDLEGPARVTQNLASVRSMRGLEV